MIRWQNRHRLPLLFIGIVLANAAPTRAQKTLKLEEEVFKSLHWRSIGPAQMGGRISDIAADPKNPFSFYIGLATGGVMKTNNNGSTWNAVFEHESCASIGALAVAPSDNKILWCGTGEPNGRNSSAWGDGIFKSSDGGQTWKNMGLKDSQSIARILIDPVNPDVVYVAVVGHLWGANKERGVYKTTDGGKTWTPSLVLGDTIGAIDLAFGAPGSGNLYAAMYERRRYPWGYEGISKNSGIYKSADFGKTWKRATGGLPEGKVGRIGLAVSASNPNIVYAVIESQEGGSGGLDDINSRYGGVFRSENAGVTWQRRSGTAPRGFYFGQIQVDPVDPDRVYVLGFEVSVSTDGGKKFAENGSRGVHADMHAMWIDPTNPDRILLGCDGGLYTTYDKAKTWQHIKNFAAGEFYEVAVDNRQPFFCYGGLQDNGSWGGPSAVAGYGGPVNSDWIGLGGGDGFYVVPDPTNPDVVYSESQGGSVTRMDRVFNRNKGMRPTAPEGNADFRFNWNTPLCVSHFDSDVVYIGGNVLVKWTKQGKEWNVISPDLSKKHGERITAAGSGAETYGTIVCLCESPLQKGTLWAGTDDGNVQLTTNNGANWINVTENLPAKVRDYYVTRIESSHVEPARAYVSIDGHRHDDMSAYLFVTEDYGKTWRSLVGDLPKSGPIKALREDPVNPNLLFVGTEYAAYASLDRGEHWRRLEGLPTVCVNDLAIQPRDHALVAATHGRSLYIMDNMAPLEELTPKMASQEVHLFSIPPALEYNPVYRGAESTEFQGENRDGNAEFSYWIKSLLDESPRLTITDAKGKNVALLSGERYPGIQKLRWDLHAPVEGDTGGRGERTRFVPPGTYTATLTVGKEKQTQKFIVSGPPELSQEPTDEGNSGEKETRPDK